MRDDAAQLPSLPAQVMTAHDIHSLRAAGAKGDDIVSALVASSATFDTKTAFSQEKYKAKKKRVHCARITAHRPTSARVCAALFSKVCVPGSSCNHDVPRLIMWHSPLAPHAYAVARAHRQHAVRRARVRAGRM